MNLINGSRALTAIRAAAELSRSGRSVTFAVNGRKSRLSRRQQGKACGIRRVRGVGAGDAGGCNAP